MLGCCIDHSSRDWLKVDATPDSRLTLTIWTPSSSSSGLVNSLKQNSSTCCHCTPRLARCFSARFSHNWGHQETLVSHEHKEDTSLFYCLQTDWPSTAQKGLDQILCGLDQRTHSGYKNLNKNLRFVLTPLRLGLQPYRTPFHFQHYHEAFS